MFKYSTVLNFLFTIYSSEKQHQIFLTNKTYRKSYNIILLLKIKMDKLRSIIYLIQKNRKNATPKDIQSLLCNLFFIGYE